MGHLARTHTGHGSQPVGSIEGPITLCIAVLFERFASVA